MTTPTMCYRDALAALYAQGELPAHLKTYVDSITSLVAELRSTVDRAVETATRYGEEKSELVADLAQAREEHLRAFAAQDQLIAKLRSELAELRAEHSRALEKNASLVEELEVLEQANKGLGVRITEVQGRCTELLNEARSYRQRCLPLPSWECPKCRCFNGEAKEPLLKCRACGEPAPTGASTEPPAVPTARADASNGQKPPCVGCGGTGLVWHTTFGKNMPCAFCPKPEESSP